VRAVFAESEGVNQQIVRNIRLPRTVVGALVGSSLALSGAILQGVMRNPLAAPNIIGVSAGAGLAAVATFILVPAAYNLIVPVAFVGSLAATFVVYTLSWKNGVKPMALVLAGVAVSSLLGAGINALMVLHPERVQGVVGFMVGGFGAVTWVDVKMLWPYALLSWLGALGSAWR